MLRSPVAPQSGAHAAAQARRRTLAASRRLRCGWTCKNPPHHDNASIIAAASEVAIEDPGNQAWVGGHQSRVVGEIPARAKAIAVQDDRGVTTKRILKG